MLQTITHIFTQVPLVPSSVQVMDLQVQEDLADTMEAMAMGATATTALGMEDTILAMATMDTPAMAMDTLVMATGATDTVTRLDSSMGDLSLTLGLDTMADSWM